VPATSCDSEATKRRRMMSRTRFVGRRLRAFTRGQRRRAPRFGQWERRRQELEATKKMRQERDGAVQTGLVKG
jgi:hypothetical protein